MTVYILESINTPKTYYVGISKDIHKRLLLHNKGRVLQTQKKRPWKIKNAFWFADSEKAIAFEMYLKSGSGRAFSVKHF